MVIKNFNELSGNTLKSAKTSLDYASRIDRKREIDFDETSFTVVVRPGKPSIVDLHIVSYLPETIKPVVVIEEEDDVEFDMLALLMG